MLFALCLRGAQCGYFALTVLRPSFPLGSPASQVVERLGKPKFDISGAEAVTHAKAVRPRLQGVGRVLLYFEGRGALHRSLYFDESGRLLADEQGEIYY